MGIASIWNDCLRFELETLRFFLPAMSQVCTHIVTVFRYLGQRGDGWGGK